MLEAVILDFDGVILDSEPLHYEACCMVLKNFGLTLTYKDYIHEYLGLSDKEMFPQLLMSAGHYLSTKEINLLVDKKIENYAYLINSRNKLPFISGVEKFIVHVSKLGKKLAICTGSTKTELLPVLERFKQGNLSEYFDVIISSEDVRFGKPSPEGYLLTLERLNLLANQCLVIEDSPYGINAAKKAGLYVIALATTHTKHELQSADKIVSGFHEITVETTKETSL